MTRRFVPPHRTIAAIFAAGFGLCATGPMTAERDSAVPAKADARTILHVLNRIGFGARPGDIDRVQRIGLATYIDQQLSPERVPDTELDARLAGFETLSMSTRELADKYYLPALQARRDQQLKEQKAEAKAKKDDPAMADDSKAGATA